MVGAEDCEGDFLTISLAIFYIFLVQGKYKMEKEAILVVS